MLCDNEIFIVVLLCLQGDLERGEKKRKFYFVDQK